MSPELVTIWVSSRNRQQDRYLQRSAVRIIITEIMSYPVWPGSSLDTRTLPSLVLRLYMLQILSRPLKITPISHSAGFIITRVMCRMIMSKWTK